MIYILCMCSAESLRRVQYKYMFICIYIFIYLWLKKTKWTNLFKRKDNNSLGIEFYFSTWEKKEKKFSHKLPNQHGGPGFTQPVKWIHRKLCYRVNQVFRDDQYLLGRWDVKPCKRCPSCTQIPSVNKEETSTSQSCREKDNNRIGA